jgi:hypothetical protein
LLIDAVDGRLTIREFLIVRRRHPVLSRHCA